MTHRAATKIYSDGTCATYTYCDHLSEGWYDEIKVLWKIQKIYCCCECASIIKLKKDQTIQEYITTINGQS
jgi:hypothetical protein